MKKLRITGFFIVIITALVAVYYFAPESLTGVVRPTLPASAVGAVPTGEPQYTPAPLTNEYKNDTYKFALSMPDGFTAQEFPADGEGTSIVLQNSKGEGIQVLVTPYTDDLRVLSADDVRADIPDMKVTDEQAVEIGADHTGVAFKSDNDAFGGASREVWFVFRGNLYQISTYARLDPLLQVMFGTWRFF